MAMSAYVGLFTASSSMTSQLTGRLMGRLGSAGHVSAVTGWRGARVLVLRGGVNRFGWTSQYRDQGQRVSARDFCHKAVQYTECVEYSVTFQLQSVCIILLIVIMIISVV